MRNCLSGEALFLAQDAVRKLFVAGLCPDPLWSLQRSQRPHSWTKRVPPPIKGGEG